MAFVQSQADSVPYNAGNPYEAFIGQNGPITPSNPFDPSAPPGGTVQAPPQASPVQPPTVSYDANPAVAPPNDILALIADSAFPGGGAPQAAPQIEGRAPTPMSGAEAVAQMQQADPNAFAAAGPPPVDPIMAFEDLPVGDFVTNDPRETYAMLHQGGPTAAPPPTSVPGATDLVRGVGANRPQVAPPTSAVAPPIMPTPRMNVAGPFTPPVQQIGGQGAPRPTPAVAPAAAPQPSVSAPQTAPRGLLRGPRLPNPGDAAALGPMLTPDDLRLAQLKAAGFLLSEPKPPGTPPGPPAATTRPGPAPVPPTQGGPQASSPAPQQGAVLPEHLKEQLLQEAIRLTTQKRMPQGAR